MLHLEYEVAHKGVLQAPVQGGNVHVCHQAGQGSVDKLRHEQLEGQASLLCTLCVMPASADCTVMCLAARLWSSEADSICILATVKPRLVHCGAEACNCPQS